jgi:hypothetical protein
MATTVHEEKSITLMDGTTFNVRPLKISLLRPFMKKFETVAAVADDNDKSMTILVECVQIALKQYSPELADDIAKLEDILDLPTVYKIVEAASGMNLSELAQVLADAE